MTLLSSLTAKIVNPNPGCRYYALMAACVLARRTEWIRSACLAAVLLFPAIAALHGIVLAALHRHGELIVPLVRDVYSDYPQEPSIWMFMGLFNCAQLGS